MLTERGLLQPRRRRRRSALALCIASPVVLCLGWSALWLFAQRQAAQAMDGWIAREAGHGREWTCPDRQISGFPLELRISCSAPTFRGKVGGDVLDVSSPGFEASASLYQPKAIEASLASPVMILKAGRDRPMTVTWTAFEVQGRLLPGDQARVAVVVDDPSLLDGATTGKADHVELHVSPAAGRPVEDKAYDVWFRLQQGSLPAIDEVTGETEPLSIDQKGVLSALEPPAGAPWPVLVEAWRQAGGTLDLTALTLTKGRFRAEAQGRLGLDEAHRVSGRLQTAMSGYEPLAARFGVPVAALSLGNAVAKLLNRHASAAPADATSVKIPLSFSDGRVGVGPVITSVRLTPLY